MVGSDLSSSVAARIARKHADQTGHLAEVKRDVIVLEEDFIHMDEIIGEPVHGILGADFFKGLIVEINYKNNTSAFSIPNILKKKNLTPTPLWKWILQTANRTS